jgi:phosphate transport system protein
MVTVNPRETFDNELRKLKDGVLVLGSMVKQNTLESVDALKRRDVKASKRVYLYDRKINEKRFELENKCVTLIATQQPMARDMRSLASTLEVLTELERMGDYAKGIGRIGMMLSERPPLKPLIDLPLMAEICTEMLHQALTAFVNEDEPLARSIPPEDDKVDALYNQIYRELITFMLADPGAIDRANYLLWAAHNLERFGDRVINICERTVYVATGTMEELDVSDDESGELE